MKTFIILSLIFVSLRIYDKSQEEPKRHFKQQYNEYCGHSLRIMNKLDLDDLDYKTKVIHKDKFINYLKWSNDTLEQIRNNRLINNLNK